MGRSRLALLGGFVIACSISLAAQRGVPPRSTHSALRLPDLPYLGANAGKPDLGGNGTWDVKRIFDMSALEPGIEKKQDVPFTQKGAAVYRERIDNEQKEDPEARCMPPGVPRMLYTPYPTQIL